MDLINLVKFVVSGEQGAQRQNFIHDTSNSPNVHFITVISVSQKTFWRSVPTGRNILCQRLILVETSTTAQVSQFNGLASQKNVFWLDVSMKNPVPMHVLDGFEELVHVVLNTLLWEIVRTAFNGFVQVLVHQLEHKGKPSGRLVVKNFNQLDNVRMGVKPLQRFDLPQVVHLVDAVEMTFHALYCYILAVTKTLRFQHFRERSFSQFPDQSVLYSSKYTHF